MITQRTAVLRHFGFTPAVLDQLITGLARALPASFPDLSQVTLGNELFVPDWIHCCVQAKREGTLKALCHLLFELNFPIAEGISVTPEYREFTLSANKGSTDTWKHNTLGKPIWEAPDFLNIFMHDTGGGLIPVIHAAVHADFATILRAIMFSNEPEPVAPSMGSSFIRGYHNRKRYLQIREALALDIISPEARDPQLWKDKFILLSTGNYSGVSAASMKLDQPSWLELSTRLRLHHESCHYLMKRLFPQLRFGLQDELIADFAGLMGARGCFSAADFLLFMGLENFPSYRAGGRLENYPRELVGGPEMAHATGFLLIEAAKNLEAFFLTWNATRFQQEKLRVLATLTWLPLEILASSQARLILEEKLHSTTITNK